MNYTELKTVLNSVISARDYIAMAYKEKCTCSGFTLQYEQGCQCDYQKRITNAENIFWNIINQLERIKGET